MPVPLQFASFHYSHEVFIRPDGDEEVMILIHTLNLSHAGSKRHTLGPRLSRRAKPREGVMLTRHHRANDLHDAGYRPRRIKSRKERNGYVFKTKASHLDGGYRLWSVMEMNGLRHAILSKTQHMKMTATIQSIPTWSSPGTRTAPSVAGHQDGGEKYATDGPKSLRARNSITIGTWNVRSLRVAGVVEELTHEMKRYRREILGLQRRERMQTRTGRGYVTSTATLRSTKEAWVSKNSPISTT